MHARTVDLNADLGEEVTDDRALLAVVTSANVACGYHAGNAEVMRAVCEEAVRRSVTVGAQVSYADRAGFGRVVVDVAPRVLAEQVADQVGALTDIARAVGGDVAYLKPHGALYHRAGSDEATARAVLAGSGSLPVLGMPGSLLLDLAVAAGRDTRQEGFPDRGYTSAGTLVPRTEPGALITDDGAVAARAVELAAVVDSVWVHGNSPDAVRHATSARRALDHAGFVVTTCWSTPPVVGGWGVRIIGAGAHARLVEVDDAMAAASLAVWARAHGVEATEIVPGARTVLFDGLAAGTDLLLDLEEWTDDGTSDHRGTGGGEVVLAVDYDGPDLQDVADLWSVSVEEVVARHTAVSFTSVFCGFAPGFAYLSGLRAEWAVPRLAEPRGRVERGSVGLADAWCGVYPTASPGGWRLLGRTDTALWDLGRDQPALLPPGTRVRFEARR